MDLLSCNSSLMLEKSLGFLWTKQAAILDNIANAETPNYREKIVTFEESLRGKLQQAARTQTPVKDVRRVLDSSPFAVTEQAVVTRMDENEAIRNAYQLRYVMSSINSDLTLLRTAVRGQ